MRYSATFGKFCTAYSLLSRLDVSVVIVQEQQRALPLVNVTSQLVSSRASGKRNAWRDEEIGSRNSRNIRADNGPVTAIACRNRCWGRTDDLGELPGLVLLPG